MFMYRSFVRPFVSDKAIPLSAVNVCDYSTSTRLYSLQYSIIAQTVLHSLVQSESCCNSLVTVQIIFIHSKSHWRRPPWRSAGKGKTVPRTNCTVTSEVYRWEERQRNIDEQRDCRTEHDEWQLWRRYEQIG